jgi:hypothetical protein
VPVRRVGLAPGFLANARVQDGFERESGGVIGKHGIAHGCSIKTTVVVEDGIAEVLANLVKGGLAWLNDFAGNNVRVYHGDTQFGKHVGDRRLAAGDAPGQPDA